MIRRTLPQRRAAETFNLRFWNQLFTITVGFYADGTPGEVCIDGGKTGQHVQSTTRDAAVVLSLALLIASKRRLTQHAEKSRAALLPHEPIPPDGKRTPRPAPPWFEEGSAGLKIEGLKPC